MPLDEIRSFIFQQIPLTAEAAHTSETAWLLFWARELGITLDAAILARVFQLRSSVCALLILDMNQRGLVAGSIDDALWKSFANSKGLKSEMWLVAYEATLKDWWLAVGAAVAFIDFVTETYSQRAKQNQPTKKVG